MGNSGNSCILNSNYKQKLSVSHPRDSFRNRVVYRRVDNVCCYDFFGILYPEKEQI